MRQYYADYQKWEDYINGMYNTTLLDKELLVKNAVLLLSDAQKFDKTCKDVINNWKVASAVNLTNKSCNRRAWIGQSACCFEYKVPEILTRVAWGKLTEKQRVSADKIADKHILDYEKLWRQKLRELSGNWNKGMIMEYQMKLPLDWRN